MKRLLTATAIVLAMATGAQAADAVPLSLIAALHGLDAATTTVVLNHGGHEALLPTQNVAVIDAIVAAQAILEVRAIQKLRADGHDKLATRLAWTIVAIRAAIVVNNVAQIRRLK